jgi:hypothetical protein
MRFQANENSPKFSLQVTILEFFNTIDPVQAVPRSVRKGQLLPEPAIRTWLNGLAVRVPNGRPKS